MHDQINTLREITIVEQLLYRHLTYSTSFNVQYVKWSLCTLNNAHFNQIVSKAEEATYHCNNGHWTTQVVFILVAKTLFLLFSTQITPKPPKHNH